eukprot:TRINITY_DN37961_c0_g1_i1.p1 TRINITY_DN37961_c0_g1~~TRINITY_DN37961_c0_g1_i1.p1  ORF type:complete len:477 (-),score=91.23 TRINITY_DN37961_c0_g1_i1:46-1476(-)
MTYELLKAGLVLASINLRRKVERSLRSRRAKLLYPVQGCTSADFSHEKVTVLDLARLGIRAALEERGWQFACSRQAEDASTIKDHWTVGSHINFAGVAVGVRWEAFQSEEHALKRFDDHFLLSRVLFDPHGVPVRCCSARLDPKGAGVAAVLRVQRQGDAKAAVKRERLMQAIEAGTAPFIPPEKGKVVSEALKATWPLVATRASLAWFTAKHRSVCFFDARRSPGVRKAIALTIDDAPCRLGKDNSMMKDVLALLEAHDAKATFMLMGKFAQGNEDDLVQLLREGHELGNHGLVDRQYHRDRAEDFAKTVEECNGKILALQRQAGVLVGVRWFRAPHGRYSKAMQGVVSEAGLTNVMCDTYACCSVIQDPQFIGNFLSEHADHGSVVLIHMPEHGFREWCLPGLRLFLEGMRERGFEVVTVGELARRAEESMQPDEPVESSPGPAWTWPASWTGAQAFFSSAISALDQRHMLVPL